MTDISARAYDEKFDIQKDVERDPCGAYMAIQAQSATIKALVEALNVAANDFYEIANKINDEDYAGTPDGFRTSICGHFEKHHKMHVEYCCDAAERALAAAKETT